MTLKHSIVSVSVLLSGVWLLYACQPTPEIKPRRTLASGEAGTENNTGDSSAEGEDQSAGDGGEEAPAEVFSMSWDNAADPGITAYKLFLIPPGELPLEISSTAIADLVLEGNQYSLSVTDAQIKEALGTTVVDPSAYCFSILAVNGVGNSQHSPKICPE
ncbi:hypothetical protein [Pseudobacteriovorax antillogorgiicola]|uniref:Uncharacterized protein n=1 Tax=Pseudobacteriovorax antillogorgiicola TaxID=1513793 RepID=A0A1Y6CLF1_9BACT|nr:hypothetical protein [Pseudobacteriovorax antillogorgiicola]TCS47579.1 hypothetical protein EDD56_12020 [Pseudobacteriovorax antillogorgiicola]SMF60387.1 hypothetical protein SAMN06296036_120120 [Pseudobacteriovorax antillogorgiicola]